VVVARVGAIAASKQQGFGRSLQNGLTST
jgi:hypothetical protein